MKKLIFIVGFLLFCGGVYSQINLEWYVKSGNLSNYPSNGSIIIDSAENIYTVAYVRDSSLNSFLSIRKINTLGEFKWEKRRQINIYPYPENYSCFIKLLTKNKIVVAYNLMDTIASNKIGLLIYNLDGNLLADETYKSGENELCFLKGVCTNKFGNIYMTGYATNQPSTYENCITLKFNSIGSLMWQRRQTQYSYGNDVISDSLDNVYVCGASDSNYSLKSYTLTIKYDSSGTQKWRSIFGFSNSVVYASDIATTIVLDDSLNVIIGCSCFTDGFRFTVIKYRPVGSLYWYHVFPALMGVNYIATDSRLYIYATGYSEISPIQIVKYTPTGTMTETFASSTTFPYLIKCPDGKFLYTAGCKINNANPEKLNFYFAKMDSNFNVINSYDFLADSSSKNYLKSFTFNANRNIFLSGYSYYDAYPNPINILTTIKLSLLTGISNFLNSTPNKYTLFQNYPNPFNPSTIIRFHIKDSRFITLKVYNILGKEVTTLVNEKLKAGEYETTFDGNNLPSGIYFYSLYADGKLIDTKKMILLK